ncbi:hypothetical protein CDAR_261861 [Caerostris darwini]|uniref:Uncharacterized protein n=1 Tax=Caerostris darwini TaxID=1538125 RepID=A0AAV4V1H3_9ARAC|nr:hypothetical protein CDAR_261861 [Caerostris darwini]
MLPDEGPLHDHIPESKDTQTFTPGVPKLESNRPKSVAVQGKQKALEPSARVEFSGVPPPPLAIDDPPSPVNDLRRSALDGWASAGNVAWGRG